MQVLVIVAATGGNLVTTMLLDDRLMQVYTIIAEGYRAEMALPEVDVVFNAIGDADRSPAALDDRRADRGRSARPGDQRPDAVARDRRVPASPSARSACRASRRRAPSCSRARTLTAAASWRARGFRFPLLLRSPGFHTGRHFEFVDAAGRLAAIAARSRATSLFAIEFSTFVARTARSASIARSSSVTSSIRCTSRSRSTGRSTTFSADMRDRPDHRAEEAAYLADMRRTSAPRPCTALEAIRRSSASTTAGSISVSTRAGNVVLFEANATMAIYYPDDDERYAYRRPAVDRVLAAFRTFVT